MGPSNHDANKATQVWQIGDRKPKATAFRTTPRRVAIVLGMLVLCCALGFVLIRPFWLPKTHFVLMVGGETDSVLAPQVPFADETLAAFKPLRDVSYLYDFSPLMRSPTAMTEFADGIAQLKSRESDVLIVYVSACGVSRDGVAYLICNNFDNRQNGRYPLAGLLQQIHKSTAHVKLLILDSGHIDYSPRMGGIVNEFPRLLGQAVRRTNDPSLWVLGSQSVFETSHVSSALKGAVFRVFVSIGLRGAADLNDDDDVDVRELADFVAANVSQWVRQRTDNRLRQTPLLVWGGGDETPTQNPVLLSLAAWPERIRGGDVAEVIRRAHTQPGSQSQAASSSDRPPDPEQESESTAEMPGNGNGSDQVAATGQPGQAPGEDPEANPHRESSEMGSDSAPGVSESGDVFDQKAAPQRTQRKTFLLAAAWAMRDQLADSPLEIHGFAHTPVDIMPQQWRKLNEELLAISRRFRTSGSIADTSIDAITRDTRRFAEPIRPLAQLSMREGRSDLTELDTKPLHSIAFSRLMANLGGPNVEIDLGQLWDAVEAESDKKLSEWLASSWQDRYNDYSELRLIRQLSQLKDVAWPLTKLAIETRRTGEDLAASTLWCSGWLERQVLLADSIRLAGEREIVAQIGTGWQDRARELLHDALRKYQTGARDLEAIWRAMHLRNQLVYRAPYYVQWHNALERDTSGPDYGRLSELLRRSIGLARLLETPGFDNITEVKALHIELTHLQEQVEASWQEAMGEADTRAPTAGDAWRTEKLLEIPLLTSQARQQWQLAAETFDFRLSRDYTLPQTGQIAGQLESLTSRREDPQDWHWLARRCQLELYLVQLATGPKQTVSKREESVAGGSHHVTASPRSPDNALSRVEQGFHECSRMRATFLLKTRPTADEEEALWEAHRKFGAAVAAVYRGLSNRIEAASRFGRFVDPDVQNRHRLRAQSALRLLSSADARQFDSTTLTSISAPLDLHNLLAWHQRRFVQARLGAADNELAFLIEAAESCRRQAASLFRLPDAAFSAPTIEITAPNTLSLENSPNRRVVVRIESRASAVQAVWIVLQYDPEVVEVGTPSNLNVYHQHLLQRAPLEPLQAVTASNVPPCASAATMHQPVENIRSRGTDRRLVRESSGPEVSRLLLREESNRLQHNLGLDLARSATIAELNVGAAASLALNITRKRKVVRSPKIIVKLIARECTTAAQPSSETEPSVSQTRESLYFVSHQINLAIPEIHLVLPNNRPGTYSRSDYEITLHPFPNRQTDYRFGVVNRGLEEKSVSVAFYPFDSAKGSVTAALESVSRLLEGLEGIEPIGTLQYNAPADGKPHFPQPLKPAAPIASPAQESLPVEQQDTAQQDTAQQHTAQGRPVLKDLLAIVTDETTGRTLARIIEIAIQRPRRYVRINVGYDKLTERIEVHVAPRDIPSFPPGGIRVECSLAAQPGHPSRTVSTELKAEESDANLFLYAPSSLEDVKLYVHIDGYPRAFVYRIPCDRNAVDIPEVTDLTEMRLVVPSVVGGFHRLVDGLPIEVEIDAPIGSFDNGQDLVMIGHDLDGDQRLRSEPSVLLHNDRELEVYIENLVADGSLPIRTFVTDFDVELPLTKREGSHVVALGILRLHGKNEQAFRVAVEIDGDLPAIERVELWPFSRTAVAGSDLEVSVWVSDKSSGVKYVEAAFDVADAGEFAEHAPTIKAIRGPGKLWTLKLKAGQEPGVDVLLLRATDHVGNTGDYRRIPVRVISATEVTPPKPATLVVRVRYRNDAIPDADLSLSSEAGEEIAGRETAPEGTYEFDELQPGNYTLTARSVIRNIPRMAELSFALKPGESIQRLSVELE